MDSRYTNGYYSGDRRDQYSNQAQAYNQYQLPQLEDPTRAGLQYPPLYNDTSRAPQWPAVSSGTTGFLPSQPAQHLASYDQQAPSIPFQGGRGMAMDNFHLPSLNHDVNTHNGMPGPSNWMHQQQQLPLPQLPSQASMTLTDSSLLPRTHVVGSQGRRGILPPDDGRPPAISPEGETTDAGSADLPPKDEEGKHPCPHCKKTYLHAKHLKRHMLRHTGVRPYPCKLCGDRFARSDILKRHFIKCEERRGNPEGFTHLSDSPSHLKKEAAKKASMGLIDSPTAHDTMSQFPPLTSMSGLNGSHDALMGGTRASEASQVRSKRSMTGPLPNQLDRTTWSNQSSRAPSIVSNSSFTSLSTLPTSSGSSIGHLQDSLPTSHSGAYAPRLSSNLNPNRFSLPQMRPPPHFDVNGLDFPTQGNNANLPMSQGGVGQQAMYSPDYYGSVSHNQQDPHTALFEQGMHGMVYNEESHHTWSLPPLPLAMYQAKANKLVDFCKLNDPNTIPMHGDRELQHWLTGENLHHFLTLYGNWQSHWPLLHGPTFNPIEAHEGLILCMMALGMVYSRRIEGHEVRTLMDRIDIAMQQTAVYSLIQSGPINPDWLNTLGSSVLEELQALTMLKSLFLWHGDTKYRLMHLEDFPRIIELCRQFGMMEPIPLNNPKCSYLHQPPEITSNITSDKWNWHMWVHQETRSRVLFLLYLTDCALAIYFNREPVFSQSEIKLQLPANDAAFEATTPQACALVLGVHGEDGQHGGIGGSHCRSQIEMDKAVELLLHPDLNLARGQTNAFSKFILVHSLHAHLWSAQRQIAQTFLSNNQDLSTLSNWNKPMSSNEWIVNGHSVNTSASTSGHATPSGSSGAQSPVLSHHNLLRTSHHAFEKWKALWIYDLPTQYPLGVKRIGFCRDAMPFYSLGIFFLRKFPPSDWQADPDTRFRHVMSALKHVKTLKPGVQEMQAQGLETGEEFGSVKDIDEDYAKVGIVLDMAKLFIPVVPGEN